jgi:cytochrome c oxidase accessory protein FixG
MTKYDELKELNKQSQATVGKQGERVWVFPKKPKGNYHQWRVVVSLLLLTILLGTPFIKYNDQPLFLFNIFERKFIIFGSIFWPQDFYIIVVAFLTLIVFIVLFTVVYGRIFCGWVCPQTIFMEMVFRKIEYWIEGDFLKQKKLANQVWDFEKTWKKSLKHLVFFAMAVIISHVFWSYIISWDEVYRIVSEPIADHTLGFITLLIFSIAFYWVFAFFREQVCIIACPYGRLQGVMLDKNSLTVIYDFIRGESREKNTKHRSETAGDCIDCHQCVDVCPTGIDIRNGTQLECINCTACMDVCDDIMTLVDKPKGLIRVDSEDGIEKGVKFKFNARIKAYTAVLILLMGVLALFIFNRSDVEASVLRGRGQLYYKTDDGQIKNLYKVVLLNKTTKDFDLSPKLMSHKGQVDLAIGKSLKLLSQSNVEQVMIITINPKNLNHIKNEIEIGFYDKDGLLITSTESKFLAP